MKKIIAMVAVTVAVFAAGAQMARSEWQGKVGDCAQNAALLRLTIGKLSAADQLAFLGQVNQAISAMPGSKDQKAAAFYAANKAAVVGATRENRTAVLAEVYATVPVEVLTVINERFAAELLNRKSSPTVTDAGYFGISTNVMAAVDKRVSTVENGGARAAFAAMMLVRASGGTIPGFADSLAGMISDKTASREAKSTWLPAALSADNPSYDQILGSTQSGEEPNKSNVNALASANGNSSSVLGDLSDGEESEEDDDDAASDGDKFKGGIFLPTAVITPGAPNPNLLADAVSAASGSGIVGAGSDGIGYMNTDVWGVHVPIPRDAILSPTIIDPKTGKRIPNPYYNKKRGDGPNDDSSVPVIPVPVPPPEPGPYSNQGF